MTETTPVAKQRPRPLSPHLQVYRPQITSVLSIMHRATGIALSVGTVGLAAWLIAAAMGPEAFDCVSKFFVSPFGIFLLLGWSWSLLYHLFSGLRHLAFDTGHGFSIPAFYRSGWTSVLLSTLATAAVWYAAFCR
jgi:succinate dehydrogenase / fumarate reductase cytochrome b subunit